MKHILLLICTLFLMGTSSLLSADEESENLDSKRIWNLLKDIKAHQAGRLHCHLESGTSISTPKDDDPVSIIYTRPEPICIPYFWFEWPTPKKDNNLVIEMEFKWPNSNGFLLFLFDTWNEEAIQDSSQIIGVLLKYGDNQGIYVGDVLSVLKGDLKPGRYKKGNLGIMGHTKLHSLKIIVKQEMISMMLDDKSALAWTGDASPAGAALLGSMMYPVTDGQESLIIHRLQMNVNMVKK